MDYKNIYLNAFNKKMEEIDSEVITQIKIFKERNKNFTAAANEIEKDLKEKTNNIRISVQDDFPDLFEKYKNRYTEYASDHLTSYFDYDFTDLADNYSASSLEECAVSLGVLEGYSRAAVNFPNADKFLEAIYVLNKNFDHYTLNFEPNENPVDSNLFHKMQKERFPGYGKESGWEEVAIKKIQKKESGKKDNNSEAETEKDSSKKVKIKPGDPFDQAEKLYILHLLQQLINHGSAGMQTPEFLRIVHLTADVIDTTANLSNNPPNYRKVHDGLKDHPKNKKIEIIESVISKLHKHKVPMLKQILKDKLKAATIK